MRHYSSFVRLLLLSVAIGGCAGTDPFGPSIALSLAVSQPAAIPSTLRVEIGNSSATLHVTESGSASTRLHVLGYGEKPVVMTLLGAQSDTLATASFSENLQAGYRYGRGVVVSRVRPLGTCVAIIQATPLRNSPSDTMFVVGSGLPEGALC